MVFHKYGAIRSQCDGIKFPSKKEAKYFRSLQLRVKAGEVVFFLRQPMFDLGGGVTYRADFLEFHADNTVHIVDVKGVKTKDFIMKKKIVESLYPVEIEVV